MGDTENSESNHSMTKTKLNRLGLFTREPRKRIRDVFDLDPHGSTYETSETVNERVPVLPRASNASLRRYVMTRNKKQARFSDDNQGNQSS
ncbi:hypothetical protein BDV28DRAFT_136939 [Aspergillus coremiiformis]|uniref:Uncharacterized protein n=1 Tax=Aspergillus coremiiformis TaxID=138285 RepID=A0A5N6Z1I0_9EURO|nr:hypothetical protein BDV28DRAFT_136939 [Aspergillus coremiiformis]